MSFQLICTSEFDVIAFQAGERAASVIRTISTLITISIVSSWCSRRNIGSLLLFFSHWLSGLVHQLAQLVLAEMVLLCWSKSELLILIKALKFLELASSNMLAITSGAICVNLALLVSSQRNLSRVSSVSSPGMMLIFLCLSVLATVAVVPVWDSIVMTGTTFLVVGDTEGAQDWVIVSGFYVELIAGLVMALIMLSLAAFRRPELRQVWKIHRRIKFYVALTLVAIFADIGIAIAGSLHLENDDKPGYLSATWSLRHMHIALDTVILYSALGASQFDAESSSGANAARSSDEPNGANGANGVGGGIGVGGGSGRKRSGVLTSSRRKSSSASVQSIANCYSPPV